MTTLITPPAHARSRLSIADDAILLIADLQAGLADLPLTVPEAQLKRNVAALMKLAAIFEIPLVVTVVPGGDGTVSALMSEVEQGLGGAPAHIRTTPNSFNDAEVRAAIEGSGRKTILVSGVATEVAVQAPSLTAAAEGYDVHVIVDACGGISPRTEAAAFARLTQAGARLSSLPALVGDLAGDFGQPKGQQAIGVLFELAGGETTSLEDNRRLVVRHFDDFVNRKDLNAIDRNMAADFIDHDGPQGRPIDRAGDRAMMAGLHKAFPDLRIDLRDVLAEGDKVMARAVWTGTNAASGARMANQGFVLWRFAGGRIVERWATVTPMRDIGEAPTTW